LGTVRRHEPDAFAIAEMDVDGKRFAPNVRLSGEVTRYETE
jgi:hypothetical protein